MVKITNGVNVFEVTAGAFDEIYSRQGYVRVEVQNVEAPKIEAPEVPEVSEEQKFCDELIEKPLGQWNKDEVKKFAEINSIDITGTKNANEAKDRIKEFLESEE